MKNFEHIYKLVYQNSHRIKNKKKTIILLKYYYELKKIKKRRAWFGIIGYVFNTDRFDLKKHKYVIKEEVEMRYINQDLSKEDAKKPENIAKKLFWQTDTTNVLAAIPVAIGFLLYIISETQNLYLYYFPEFAYRNKMYEEILSYKFNDLSLENSKNLKKLCSILKLNLIIVDLISEYFKKV